MFKKKEIISRLPANGDIDGITMDAVYRRRLWRKFTANRLGVIGCVIIIALITVAGLADFLAPYSFKKQELSNMYLAPSQEHPMGTDEFGRDVLSRVIYGSRISVYVGVVSVGLSVVIGILIGSVAGYYGGWIDQVLTTIADLTWSLPEILVALLLVAVIGAGVECVIVAIALTYWAQYARLIRGQILMLKNETYIEATLGFLGLGAQPPLPSWGAMMSSGTAYLFISPRVIIFPGLAMMITVLGFNLFGDALVDLLDIKDTTTP